MAYPVFLTGALLALVLSLFTLPLQAADDPPFTTHQVCHRLRMEEGPLPGLPSYRLGPPTVYDQDDILAGQCSPLYHEDQLIAWITEAHALGAGLYIRRCSSYGSLVAPGEELHSNSENEDYERLSLESPSDPPDPLELEPHLSASFCNGTLAYWSHQQDRTDAVIYDLISKRIVRRAPMGRIRSIKGTTLFLPAPQWSKDGTEVTFSTADADVFGTRVLDGEKKMTFSLKEKK